MTKGLHNCDLELVGISPVFDVVYQYIQGIQGKDGFSFPRRSPMVAAVFVHVLGAAEVELIVDVGMDSDGWEPTSGVVIRFRVSIQFRVNIRFGVSIFFEVDLRIEIGHEVGFYKMRLVSYEFDGYALVWWKQYIREDLRTELKVRFVPTSYARDFYNKLQRRYQGFKSVYEYFK
ncbi:hypothetical protein CR513_33206, partial [Mucuna pruriens]